MTSATPLSTKVRPPKRTATSPTVEFFYNHPKAYIAALIAADADCKQIETIEPRVVAHSERACKGAQSLGLLSEDNTPTEFGTHVADAFTDTKTHEQLIEEYSRLKGTHKRFINLVDYSQQVVLQDALRRCPAVGDFCTILQTVGKEITLPTLAEYALTHSDSLNVDHWLFRYPKNPGSLTKPDTYRSAAVCQFPTILYHAGILTTRGTDTGSLDPSEETYQLEPQFRHPHDRYTGGGDRR